MNVQLPGTGTIVNIRTLDEFGGDRSAWVTYLAQSGAYIIPAYNALLVWQDGDASIPTDRQSLATALRKDANFWEGLRLRAISGSVVLPSEVENAIPAALDTPPANNPNINPVTNVYTAPALTPPAATINGGQYVRYRFIMGPNHHPELPRGKQDVYDTGANLSTCNRANPSGCDPKQFATLAEVLTYADAHGETVVKVGDVNQAFNIVEGKAVVSPDMVVTATSDVGGGIGILTILGLAATLFKHKG